MAIEIVYETHSTTEDNEQGIATGWLPGRLSEVGRNNAVALGQRRRDDGLAAIFVSDLGRAVETVDVAFAGSGIPVLLDWRLRECDYGRLNGAPAAEVHRDRRRYLDVPYPDGESWRQATDRVGRASLRFTAEMGWATHPRGRSCRHPLGPRALAARGGPRRVDDGGVRLAGRLGVHAWLDSDPLVLADPYPVHESA